MKISSELRTIISDAYIYAQSQHHEFVTPEHLLREALNYRSVLSVIIMSGGNFNGIRDGLDEYLAKNVPILSTEQSEGKKSHAKKNASDSEATLTDYEPIETVALKSVMDRTYNHCMSSDKETVEFSDVIVSMLDETKNYCSYVLKSQGIERLKLIEMISYLKEYWPVAKKDQRPLTSEEQKSAIRQFSDLASMGKIEIQPELIDPSFQPQQPGGAVLKSALEKFTIDLTKLAQEGKLEKLIGREEELDRTIQILCRRTKNNPLHVGDAGVGKTAITEGLAVRIVNKEVPELLNGFSIYSLSMASVLAGTKFRGDFEERLKHITDELMQKDKAILFIDEIHTIIGAGSTGTGTVDAANILKPLLTNGKIRCIGSTTFEEYTKIFEKDRALARRFQKIDILEPSAEETVKILAGLSPEYEKFHGVTYEPNCLQTAVDLSVQYIPDRRLPDKAIDIMDEAGAWVKIHGERQQEEKLPVTVDVIRKVTAKMARVPVETVTAGEKEKLRSLNEVLSHEIFGQQPAVDSVTIAVKKARAGFRNPDKPEASFLFVGPTGVGKTELARVLARTLNEKLLRFDMSEYQEKHTVSRLIGSPPGYVGFEEGGLLTDAVRKEPHAVILFDEIEKAHEDIYNILLQVMDYGQLTDNQGRKADFRNTIIIMTSNAGAREMEKEAIGFSGTTFADDEKNNADSLKEAVNKTFTPEFRNRLDAVVTFMHLSKEVTEDIARKEIQKIADRLAQNSSVAGEASLSENDARQKITLVATEEAVSYIARTGYSKEFGARNIARAAENQIASPLVDEVLFGKLAHGGKVTVALKDDKIVFEYE